MQKQTPKPYLQLSGCSILEHSIRRFIALDGLVQIIIATSKEYVDEAESILANTLPNPVSGHCIIGGAERQDSIRNALAQVAKVDMVMVHDAVRPFVQIDHIESCCKIAADVGGAVLGVPVKDTIKRINEEGFIQETPNRKYVWQTQTPQVFQKDLIVEAYKKASDDNFTGTDDSSLVERLGKKVKMVRGTRANFKITYPLDLELARLIIENKWT